MNKRITFYFIISILMTGNFNAQIKSEANPLLKLNFLAGEWIEEGSGANSGASSFRFDLDSSIITRNNFANYPASNWQTGNKSQGFYGYIQNCRLD